MSLFVLNNTLETAPTLREVNAKCPRDNRFAGYHDARQDTLPNTNTFVGVIEELRSQVGLINALKVSQMNSVSVARRAPSYSYSIIAF